MDNSFNYHEAIRTAQYREKWRSVPPTHDLWTEYKEEEKEEKKKKPLKHKEDQEYNGWIRSRNGQLLASAKQ